MSCPVTSYQLTEPKEISLSPYSHKNQLDIGYELVWGLKDQLAEENKQVTRQKYIPLSKQLPVMEVF